MSSLEDRKVELECEKLELDLAARRDPSRTYFFEDEVCESTVRHCIKDIGEWARMGAEEITVVFTSPGGSVFDGLALFDYIRHLRDSGIVVDTETMGWAASMGAVLLQAGTTRRMGRNAWVMIHEPSAGMRGKASAFKDEADLMARLAEQTWTILSERSTLSPEDIKTHCERRDWWLSADECMELGLVDQLF